jgi:hypothetical protein
MNTEGLEVLLDNIEIRGIDQIKEMAKQWMEQMRQAKQQQMQQQANMPNPEMMKAQISQQKLQHDQQKAQTQFMIDMEKLKQDERKVLMDAMQEKEKNQVQILKAQTERFARQVDLELKGRDQHHRHTKETIETHRKLNPSKEISNE